MCSALTRLNDEFDIERIVVSTYQAVSGAADAALDEVLRGTQEELDRIDPVRKTLPCAGDKKHFPIAFNCIPQVDKFDLSNGYSKEEMKMVNETKKIFNKDIEVNATCVRVPVMRAHSEATWVETERPVSVEEARKAFAEAEGVILQDEPAKKDYPMPLFIAGKDPVYVGRIRKDITNPNGLTFWTVSDQIKKGAALNAVQIAEYLLKVKNIG